MSDHKMDKRTHFGEVTIFALISMVHLHTLCGCVKVLSKYLDREIEIQRNISKIASFWLLFLMASCRFTNLIQSQVFNTLQLEQELNYLCSIYFYLFFFFLKGVRINYFALLDLSCCLNRIYEQNLTAAFEKLSDRMLKCTGFKFHSTAKRMLMHYADGIYTKEK